MNTCGLMIISRSILLIIRIFQARVVQIIKRHILCSVMFIRKSYLLQDNVEKYGTARQATDDNIIRCVRFACWIIKATDTVIMYNTYCFSTETMVTRTRLNVTLYVHCCLFIFQFFIEAAYPQIMVGVPVVVRGQQFNKPCCRIPSIIVDCLCLHCSVQGEDTG
jgi:hypothetical protein